MKKKLSLLLLSIFMLPLIALFGCDEPVSYNFYAHESSSIFGTARGGGKVEEGKTVTLTAHANNGSYFLGWVYQNNLLIDSSDETYTIKNEESGGRPIKSTLTFTSRESTQGSYTAVFNENKVMYYRFTGFMISSTALPTPREDDGENAGSGEIEPSILSLTELSVTQNSTTVYTSTSGTRGYKDSEKVYIPENKNMLLLDYDTSSQIVTTATFENYENLSATFTFRQAINFNRDVAETPEDTYTSQVKFENKTCRIVFKFTFDSTVNQPTYYYFTLFYESL